jgi:FMN reductase
MAIVKVLGVSGSMQANSTSAKALQIALESAIKHGAETRTIDLLALDLPMLRPDNRPDAPSVREATEAVNWAQAYIIATPDYHGGMAGSVKNFLDYFWHEFEGKMFAYICASHEKGLTVMDQLRTTIRQCYGWSLPYGVTINSSHDFDKHTGLLTSDSVRKRLRFLGRDVAVYGEVIYRQYQHDLTLTERETFAGHTK